MTEKRYLFKNAAGQWILGNSPDSVVIQGSYEKYTTTLTVDETEVDAIGFTHVSRERLDKKAIPVTDYLKNSNGDAYTDLEEIETAIADFFVKASTVEGGGASMGITTITGTEVTDYAMPNDCDVTGAFLITNNFLDATLLDVGGTPTIRFSVAPTTEQSTYVLYTLA